MPNKAQFVDILAERLGGDRKRAAAALDAVIDSVYATIARGERVAITGFGVFERRERAARVARNPATGARVDVPASRVPAFRPGAEFKAIAGGARDILEERSARTQAAVARAAESVREAPGKAVAAVKDAQGRATNAVQDAVAAVKNTPASKAASKAAKKAAKRAQKQGAKKAAPAKSVAKKAAKKAAPAKKAAKKAAPATKKAAAKQLAATKTAPAKKSTAAKKLAKKAPAKKAAKKSGGRKR
ncbi:MAG: DNA-binding protein HU-beta [Pseudonocardiales bacterium]|nr:DNA-binding protein HU-beta [Pseudonocardiales bacterium]